MPASLLLGVVWALWHTPLFWTVGRDAYGAPFVIMLVELPAMSVLYTWVFQHTAGSPLLAILFHAAWNLSAISATYADTARSARVVPLMKWALARAVGAYWLRRSNRGPVETKRHAEGTP